MGLLDWIKVKTVTDPPEVYGKSSNQSNEQQYDYEFISKYNYVVFSPFIDEDKIVNKTSAYYTPESSAQFLYIRKVWMTSNELLKREAVYPKQFFENIEILEDLLSNCPYCMERFNPRYELTEFNRRKEQIIIDFVNRSFKDCFRCALELKTVKGRVNHMENWFLKMNYYKQFMSERAQYILDNLYVEWSGELRQIAER